MLFIVYGEFEFGSVYQRRKYLEKTQWLKRKDIKRIQTKLTRALLKHAYDNVKFYHNSFRKAGFNPTQFLSLDDMSKVPILTKREFRENIQRMRAINIPVGTQKIWNTSGTTATSIQFYRDTKDIGRGLAAELRGLGWAGYEVGEKMALLWNYTRKARSVKFRIGNRLRRCKFQNIHNISQREMENFANQLHHFKPKFIRAHAGVLNLFASFLQQNKRFDIRPSAIFTSCETLLPNYRKNIEKTFGCKIYDYYASSEVSHIGAQCDSSNAFHVTDENILVEIVEDGQKASPGEEGKLLVTNLHSYGMPLIRYEIGDLGRILPDECACGRKLTMLKVLGRTNEYFVTANGSFLFLKDFHRFFEDLPIINFEVVQESLDEVVVNIVPAKGYEKKHTDFILQNLKYIGSGNIRVKQVDSICPQISGKTTHIVSKVKSNY